MFLFHKKDWPDVVVVVILVTIGLCMESRVAAAAGGTPDQIHLSWSLDPSTTLSVIWHTSSALNPNLVEYRPVGQSAWLQAVGSAFASPGSGILHRVDLTGLAPGTAYEYRVSADTGALPGMSAVSQTRTAPPTGSPQDYTFVFVSDTGLIGRLDGNANGTEQIIAEVQNEAPLFFLGGGDYAYANRDLRFATVGDAIDEWFNQWQPVSTRFPFMAAYGNHEVFLTETFDDWASRFAHPAGYDSGRDYSFDVGDVHFVALFVPGNTLTAGRLAWLDADLAAARSAGARWLIAYQHEPIYAVGHSHPANPAIRAALSPIFEKYSLDLHLSAHDQSYERTYPLTNVPASPDSPTMGSNSLTQYTQGSGVIYAKVSPSGKMSERRNDFSRFQQPQQFFMAVRDDTTHHYAVITIRASGQLEYKAYQVIGAGPMITSPVPGTDLVKGQTYTLEGTGTNPSWQYDGHSDGLGVLDIGSGSPLSFEIPTDITAGAQTIDIILTADEGTRMVTYNVVSSPGNIGTPGPLQLKTLLDWFVITVSVAGRPTASISAPSAGMTFNVNDSIAFDGSASDLEDGTLSGTNLAWEYDLSGAGAGRTSIGTGSSGAFLAPVHPNGTYPYVLTIYLTASDSDGMAMETSVQVTIEQGGSNAPTIAFTTLIITGTVDDLTIAYVRVNGADYATIDGQYSAEVALGGNSMTIAMEAGDSAVGLATRTLIVSNP